MNSFVGTKIIDASGVYYNVDHLITEAIKTLLAEATRGDLAPIVKHLGINPIGNDKVAITLISV